MSVRPAGSTGAFSAFLPLAAGDRLEIGLPGAVALVAGVYVLTRLYRCWRERRDDGAGADADRADPASEADESKAD